MKKIANRIAIVLVILAVSSVMAFAKIRSKEISFGQDVTINGTLVKKGTYKVQFNEETGELTIFVKNQAIKTSARLQERAKRSNRTEFVLVNQGESAALKSITFAGDKQSIVLGDSGPAAAAQ